MVLARGLKAAVIGSCLGVLVICSSASCGLSRRAHEPLQYPATKIASSGFELEVVDSRPTAALPSARQLTLPRDFEARARERLARVIQGGGAPLRVRVSVVAADEIELVDARGEITRVVVRLNIQVQVEDGPELGRVETQSSSDLPRGEATPEEIAVVLDETAQHAFDRYWANPETPVRLNRNLAAYARQR